MDEAPEDDPGEVELPGLVELGELELGELELGDAEFVSLRPREVLFSFLSLSEFVEFTLLGSLLGLAPGVLGVLGTVFGDVTPGELGVVLPGCAPGVVAPG